MEKLPSIATPTTMYLDHYVNASALASATIVVFPNMIGALRLKPQQDPRLVDTLESVSRRVSTSQLLILPSQRHQAA